MKKLFFLSAIALLVCAIVGCDEGDYVSSDAEIVKELPTAQNNSEYFYYYKGKKQYLELNTDYVFISSSVNQLPTKYLHFFSSSSRLKRENAWDKMKQNRNFEQSYWGELKLQKKLSKQDYFELINSLKKEKNIRTVSPYFKTKDTDKIGLSNFFYVKLKKASDRSILEEQVKKHSCLIVQQDEFMPLWFVLSVTKQSTYNALQLANLFYESELFEYAEPDLMIDDILNCANDEFFNNQWGLKNTGQNARANN